MRVSPAVLLAVLGLGACSGASVLPPTDGILAEGDWGGENAGVIVTASSVHVHVGCTFGDVAGKITLDESGSFSVDGSYVLRAYPIAVGPSLPARFTGRVRGGSLTLSIAVNDTVEKKQVPLGPVTVVYGRAAEMGPCPICKVPPFRGSSTRNLLSGWRFLST
jgi:hypothetical protein